MGDSKKPEVKWVETNGERYVTGNDFFRCYEWCESLGKHRDEFDRCVKECLGVTEWKTYTRRVRGKK